MLCTMYLARRPCGAARGIASPTAHLTQASHDVAPIAEAVENDVPSRRRLEGATSPVATWERTPCPRPAPKKRKLKRPSVSGVGCNRYSSDRPGNEQGRKKIDKIHPQRSAGPASAKSTKCENPMQRFLRHLSPASHGDSHRGGADLSRQCSLV
ncbi:hypothetical protein EJ06DRAFT_158292 [Trichodelitschia bisporula]|uniref:Uncharacterized protein n=1 Tax=Trichodelitschia bisporula TaxID=703511 RepID=A0A6G1HLU5_9PEZI|nr:hypothetical protein EJ06DRAFT_158292 [Trichodelitschia bisporula]